LAFSGGRKRDRPDREKKVREGEMGIKLLTVCDAEAISGLSARAFWVYHVRKGHIKAEKFKNRLIFTFGRVRSLSGAA
jgi:hypothetical protein